MVCHHFCPEALAGALTVNKTAKHIDLSSNKFGNEEAKAGCLAMGTNVGVRDFVLDRCGALGSF